MGRGVTWLQQLNFPIRWNVLKMREKKHNDGLKAQWSDCPRFPSERFIVQFVTVSSYTGNAKSVRCIYHCLGKRKYSHKLRARGEWCAYFLSGDSTRNIVFIWRHFQGAALVRISVATENPELYAAEIWSWKRHWKRLVETNIGKQYEPFCRNWRN